MSRLIGLSPALVLLTLVAACGQPPVTGSPIYSNSSPSAGRTELTAGTIQTVAGDGRGGYGGDGGPAAAAQLHHPSAIAIDQAGNLYIADAGNNRIRKVDLTGRITNVAGSGAAGYSGDGGLATAAAIDSPLGLAVDSARNLYIADSNNDRVRMVTTSGIITTIAGNGVSGNSGDGGPGALAAIGQPWGIAVDRGGNVYFTSLQTVRKVDRTGVISTVAGNGRLGVSGDGGPAILAQLYDPQELAVDQEGNLYIADYGGNGVRKIDHAGRISTIVGRAHDFAEDSGDGGPATAAQLLLVSAVAVDGCGDVFLADIAFPHYRGLSAGQSRIRGVDRAGIIRPIAGNGRIGYSGDGGPALSASLSSPQWLAVDGRGDLYIADYGNNRIRKVIVAPSCPLSE